MTLYLADTNLLLRFVELSHPMAANAVGAIQILRVRGDKLHVCPQNLIEFWAVASRPVTANGLGMTTVQADAELTRLLALFPLLPEPSGVFAGWRRLGTAAGISGRPTHDARLMAVAEANGMDALLTFNVNDFARFGPLVPTVQVTDPNML